MSIMESITETGIAMYDLVVDQAEWSQQTFGADSVRGPLGSLAHLELEAREAWNAAMEVNGSMVVNTGKFKDANAKLREELADCFLLLLDASRRAGVKPLQLIQAAQTKMTVNRSRQWPTPTPNDPAEHIR